MSSMPFVKVIIGLSALLALALNQWLLWRAWPPAVIAATVAGAAAYVTVRRVPRVTLSILLGAAFAYPALLAILAPVRGHSLDGIWSAGMLGAALGMSGWRWSMGTRWGLALGSWGLAVALSWPLIVLRETDFTLALLSNYQRALSTGGVSAPELARWATSVALVHLGGVLWIDAIIARYRERHVEAFEREIVAPLAIGGLAGAAVALYQMFVDFGAPVGTAFTPLRRATGLMLDANTFGVAAALAGLMVALLTWPRGRRPLGVAALALAGVAVWGSSSRTAFAAWVIGAGAVAWMAGRHMPSRTRRALVAGAVVVILSLVVAQAVRPAVGIGGGRLLAGIARPGASPLDMAASLWSRDGYGTLSTKLIADFPLAGIGIGSFHLFVIDFGLLKLRNTLPADNAQNWFRHQLVEMGVLGSAGWIAWVCLFVPLLVSRPRAPDNAPRARVVAAAILALGLISLVGMPTQTITLAFAFWILVYWFLALSGRIDSLGASVPHPRRWWAAAACILLVFLAATARSATADLRVPLRAANAGWPYEYGLYRTERSSTGAFRWTGKYAVAVFRPGGPYLRLQLQARHPDIARNPVDVRVKMRGQTIIRPRLRSTEMVEYYVQMPADGEFAMLEFFVDRTFTAAGGARELGIVVQEWEFRNEAPPNAWIYKLSTVSLPPRSP